MSCNLDQENVPENKITTMKIKNESSKNIGSVLWNNINFKEDSLFIGSWNGTYVTSPETNNRNANLAINNNKTYSVSFSALGMSGGVLTMTNEAFSGSWQLKDNNTLTLINGGELLLLSENKATLKWYAYSKKYTIRWWERNYELSKSSTEDIKYGTSITKTVEPGSGYIFFSIGTIAYRTRDLIIVEKGIDKEFVFSNYTLVIKLAEPDNIKILGEL
jgi:hypothetical protein